VPTARRDRGNAACRTLGRVATEPRSIPLLALQDKRAPQFQGQLGPVALARSAIDAAAAVGTLFAAVLAYGGRIDGACLVLALLVFAMTFPAGPERDSTGPARLARDILADWLAIVGLLALLGWASGTLGAFDARTLVAWALATPLVMYAAHRAAPPLLGRVLAAEDLQRTAVIAGANALGRRLAERIEASPLLGLRVAGYFDDRERARIGDVDAARVLGRLEDLVAHVKRHRIDVIYVALPMSAQPRLRGLLDALRDTTASIYFVPDVLLFDLIQARLDSIGGIPVLAVCESPFRGLDALLKRASDLVLASAILVLIAPLMALIALGVKLSSPGPVLFGQRRYGLDGREIVVYKFRTMTCMEDGDVIRQAQGDDARITRFGAFLRRSSLDELPQFINVLQGRMSVVGPRPHAVAHNELYRKLIRGYMIRHKVRPGITGLAQVNGLRGETATLEQMRARIENDLAYLRGWSLLLDLQIVIKTVAVVLRGQNAH
jgi:putative colanic acid biosynthesis UDP-glucose lipid carrier transferase